MTDSQSSGAPPKRGIIQGGAMLILGLVLPIVLLIHAFFAMSAIRSDMETQTKGPTIAAIMTEARPQLSDAFDYALYATLNAERVNMSVMLNKQLMKIVVMEIGFAVISLGMMLILLGFNDGGGEAAADAGNFKFNFKTASSGVLVFVIGAGMATAGGVLRNEYTTVGAPAFSGGGAATADLGRYYYNLCQEKAPGSEQACFASAFKKYVIDGKRD